MTNAFDLTATSDLGPAVALAHRAVQPLSLAARANLDAVADDSHSSLIWDADRRMFLSQSMGAEQIGLSLPDLTLVCLRKGVPDGHYPLAGRRVVDASDWLDQHLQTHGLRPTTEASRPYELPQDAEAVSRFPDTLPDTLGTLAGWYSLASAGLERLRDETTGLTPGPGPVRVWPHHFDIAIYVSLEEGDAEEARGIGCGLSPGDESYAQPYFYVNPWPAPDAAKLGQAPAPGHVHREGFVGMIATAEEILSLDDIGAGTDRFLSAAFGSARTALGF